MKRTIQIVEDTDGISCELHGGETARFDISFILGDFINIEKIEKDQDGRERTVCEFSNHIFTKVPEEIQYQVYYDETFVHDNVNAFEFIKKYLNHQNTKTNYSNLIKFEGLKNQFNVKFTYEISFMDEITDDAVTSYNKPLGDFSELKNNISWFTYTCHSITDMVAAILHFYLLTGYRLIKCKHCGQMFATKDLKEKYCKRISLYYDIYSQKQSKPNNCEQVVRNAIQQQKRKRERILKKMRQSISFQIGEASLYGDFLIKCDEFITMINAEPTIGNLSAYNEYLEDIENSWKGGKM